jgi:MFS family permease
MLLAGHLADRWGRKWVMVIALATMSVVFLAYTLSPFLAWIVAVQVVRSFAYSCFEAPALLYATELGLRHQRGRLAGLYYSAGGMGNITGSIVGGRAADLVGLPPMFRAVATLMLVTAVVMGKVMPRLAPTQQRQVDLPLTGTRRSWSTRKE